MLPPRLPATASGAFIPKNGSSNQHGMWLPDGIAFIAITTMVKHALADSAYQARVAQCAAAVAAIRRKFPSVESLRDVSPEQLDSVTYLLPALIARRARHVVTENVR